MHKIQFNQNKFFIHNEENQEIALITFKYKDSETIIIDHTFVNPNYRGQQLAQMLLEEVVSFARKNNLKIIPICSYAVKVLNKDLKYQDVL